MSLNYIGALNGTRNVPLFFASVELTTNVVIPIPTKRQKIGEIKESVKTTTMQKIHEICEVNLEDLEFKLEFHDTDSNVMSDDSYTNSVKEIFVVKTCMRLEDIGPEIKRLINLSESHALRCLLEMGRKYYWDTFGINWGDTYASDSFYDKKSRQTIDIYTPKNWTKFICECVESQVEENHKSHLQLLEGGKSSAFGQFSYDLRSCDLRSIAQAILRSENNQSMHISLFEVLHGKTPEKYLNSE